MGMNLISGCHRCKEQCYHYRGEENKTILPFYHRHYACMRENPSNVVTFEDQIQEQDWMRSEDGYTDWRPSNNRNENLFEALAAVGKHK